MKPANFPERKRQRQLRALARIKPVTAGKADRCIAPRSNDDLIVTLHERTVAPLRAKRTKKDCSVSGRIARAAEEAWQFDRLIAWLSDDEPQDWPLPALKQAEAA